ncbi:R2-like ligand-binding oxidase [Gemmatimonas sp.]|uniref:R2-like ligand-binding oxidase n=1 Tax=Gemmatimonas sp. TaxID=1962908 RepID=UPI003983D726
MTDGLFTETWAIALGDALHRSDSYRSAAKAWEGSVILDWSDAPITHVTSDAKACGVFLDLHRGDCRAARLATASDYAAAQYVLSTDITVWTALLEAKLTPTMALLRGKLTLKQGSIGTLMPHVNAASALVRVAQTVKRTPATRAPAFAHKIGPASAAPSATTPSETARPFSRPLQSTSAMGLRYDLLPMRLWEKAKRLGTWNPSDIDFTRDRADWLALAPDEQDMLLRLTSLFQAGEECVTLDILPLLDVISQEGRLEEQLYLTSFLWEEAKHVEAFRRFFDQVADEHSDLSRFHSPSYHTIFAVELPDAMGRLRTDASPIAQARASATYNMIVEGVLAETGYHTYHRVLTARGLMPGMQRVAALLKADESRHLAYGIFLLSRLVAEHGDSVWDAITTRMEELLPSAIAIITEAFSAYPPDRIPFGLAPETFVTFATGQFQRRMERIERARHQSIAQINALEALESAL